MATTLTLTIDGTIVVVRGFKAGNRLKASGVKAVYSASAGGWMVDRARLADLLAFLQSRNIGHAVVDPDEPGDAT